MIQVHKNLGQLIEQKRSRKSIYWVSCRRSRCTQFGFNWTEKTK